MYYNLKYRINAIGSQEIKTLMQLILLISKSYGKYLHCTLLITGMGWQLFKCLTSIHWHKPFANYVKLNIDAAYSIGSGKKGLGRCIRDDGGCFLVAQASFYDCVLRVHEGDALDLLKAISWAKSLISLHHVIFELECVSMPLTRFKTQMMIIWIRWVDWWVWKGGHGYAMASQNWWVHVCLFFFGHDECMFVRSMFQQVS